jgi:hypothetical protein
VGYRKAGLFQPAEQIVVLTCKRAYAGNLTGRIDSHAFLTAIAHGRYLGANAC